MNEKRKYKKGDEVGKNYESIDLQTDKETIVNEINVEEAAINGENRVIRTD